MNAHLKSKNQLLVEVFMAKVGTDTQPLPVSPTLPDTKTRFLRARLMLEECLETIQKGLGLDVHARSQAGPIRGMEDIKFTMRGNVNIFEIADGLADQEVVNLGTASSCGIAHQPIFEEVARNNLLKFAPGHKIDEGGKLIKPPDHRAPMIKELRDAQSNYYPISYMG